jgi:DNA mismatch repair protein MutS2
VGDRVIDAVLGLRGRVDAIEGEQAVVIGPSGRMRLPLARLAVDPTAPREPTAPAPPRVEVRVGAQDAGPEVDVRGRRADEAREIARDHVDRAALAGLASVRVIHGHGTGALRAAIREEMARHPLVERILVAPPERGGDGATLVYLDAAAAEE